ncbi:MAG: hypothetical protein ACRCW6_02640 [Mycoplasmoidaceae bacterium]
MKEKSKLVEEMVNRISNETAKKIIENINIDFHNILEKEIILERIAILDKEIASKLAIIYKNSDIKNEYELQDHIINIVKIRAINRTRRINLDEIQNDKRDNEWKNLEALVSKIESINNHYKSLPKKHQKMIDECLENVKRQLLIMSIKENNHNNIKIKENILKRLNNLIK